MGCKISHDEFGDHYTVPAAPHVKTPKGVTLNGCPSVEVWWDREPQRKYDENLVIRQENEADRADVVLITQGQVYDLIHALGWAIKRP